MANLTRALRSRLCHRFGHEHLEAEPYLSVLWVLGMGVQQLSVCLLHMGINQMPNLHGPEVATRALHMWINIEELGQFFYTTNNIKILFLVSSFLSFFTALVS